jgi:predicted AlkP superfamily pyrophosphatase or phosphodiesterase
MAEFLLAQVNVGRLVAPLDDPRIDDFRNNLDRINALADAAPGFVWRLVGEGDNATDIDVFGDPLQILNMSVWTDMASLGAYVYRTAHREIMVRRREWFEPPTEAFQCLWWVRAGHRPTPQEAVERLTYLRRHGPSPFAFTFREPFAPGARLEAEPPVLDTCA